MLECLLLSFCLLAFHFPILRVFLVSSIVLGAHHFAPLVKLLQVVLRLAAGNSLLLYEYACDCALLLPGGDGRRLLMPSWRFFAPDSADNLVGRVGGGTTAWPSLFLL